jgi:hypothetical protein
MRVSSLAVRSKVSAVPGLSSGVPREHALADVGGMLH